MNRSTKGALAAGAGVLLLLGGAGSLAYWNDSASVAGGTINSGRLSLTDTTVGTCSAAAWKLDSAETPGGATFNPATDTLVPGDVLTKSCTYTVGAKGTHLRATLSTSGGAVTGALSPSLSVSSTFTVNGAAATQVTSANDGNTLAATIVLTFDPAAGNATQLKAADLSNFVVSLQQVHS